MDYETEAWWLRDTPLPPRDSNPSEVSLEGELEGGWFTPSPTQARLLEIINKQLQAAIAYTPNAE